MDRGTEQHGDRCVFTIIANPRAVHQTQHQQALVAGLKAHGIESRLAGSENQADTNLVACWGWRIGKRLRERGHRVLVMERGYLGDRFAYTSLGWNGLNGHADFPVLKKPVDESRFKALGIDLQPWRYDGDYALILGQVPHDASLKGRDMVPWYTDIAYEIGMRHHIPVKFRPHPDLRKKGLTQHIPYTEQSTGTLAEDLTGARFTVCFNSNASVDSVLAGIPCFVGDTGSMAWDMCSPDLNHPVRKDRREWAAALAWKQWTMDEISDGSALHGVIGMI